jgi:hypothetical protein
MTKSESIKALATALCAFQAEIANVKKTSDNPFFKSKYAKLEDVLNEYRPIWTKHGLFISQTPCSADGKVGVTTRIYHTSGEWIESDPYYLQLVKNDPQGAGSAITYARRYALAAELGIQQEDDDGETHRTEGKDPTPKADPLKSVKDKAVKEIAAFNPTDQEINAIDLAKDKASIEAIVLTSKARFERLNTETEETIKADIVKGWNALKYPLKHQVNSMQKHIAVDNLDACHDLGVLRGYREHLREEYRVSKESANA